MEIFGSDIELDSNNQAKVAANGELILSKGVDTGVQDIKLRLLTPLGSLFYDKDFGSLIHNWFYEESTNLTRMGFESEVEQRLRLDPRVQIGTESCTIVAWDETSITAKATWTFIDEDHPHNLVIEVNSDKKELVIKDVNPG